MLGLSLQEAYRFKGQISNMVHLAEQQKNTDSPKTGVGEIDNRVPFQSMKNAVSLFDEVTFYGEKPAIKVKRTMDHAFK